MLNCAFKCIVIQNSWHLDKWLTVRISSGYIWSLKITRENFWCFYTLVKKSAPMSAMNPEIFSRNMKFRQVNGWRTFYVQGWTFLYLLFLNIFWIQFLAYIIWISTSWYFIYHVQPCMRNFILPIGNLLILQTNLIHLELRSPVHLEYCNVGSM